MEGFGVIFVLLLLLLGIVCGPKLLQGWRQRQEERLNLIDDLPPADILQNVLREIGCQPSADEDGSVFFAYQGEKFVAHCGGRYAHLWDLGWSGIKSLDPELSNLKWAINLYNFNFGPTIVMSEPDDEGVMVLHSHMAIMLHSANPNNSQYVRAMLDMFFQAKDGLHESYNEIKQAEVEKTRNRRPIGFAANADACDEPNA